MEINSLAEQQRKKGEQTCGSHLPYEPGGYEKEKHTKTHELRTSSSKDTNTQNTLWIRNAHCFVHEPHTLSVQTNTAVNAFVASGAMCVTIATRPHQQHSERQTGPWLALGPLGRCGNSTSRLTHAICSPLNVFIWIQDKGVVRFPNGKEEENLERRN